METDKNIPKAAEWTFQRPINALNNTLEGVWMLEMSEENCEEEKV